MTTHGEAGKTPEYAAWKNMRARCLDKNASGYERYGGRGIKVCKRWICSYENFLRDMGRRQSTSHSIERRRNNGNYTPSNCFWATRTQQCRNTCSNRLLTLTMPVVEWCDLCNLKYTTISNRIKNGWSTKDALMTPARKTSRIFNKKT